jgi:hypothetical protein
MNPDIGPDESASHSRRRYMTHLQQLQGLRGRQLGSGRVLLIVGAVLVPLGIALVLLGWQGASNTPLVFEQIPYMISGGLLGLGLMVLGGLVYFGYWLSLLVKESRLERREMIALLSSIKSHMEGNSRSEDVPPVTPEPASGTGAPSPNGSARRRRTSRSPN